MTPVAFQQRVLAWFDQHGRKDLPWQSNITPYRVWVSEIMLQQTQVTTVIPYFQAFIDRFPDVESLALASIDEVLRLWSGLGYYARGRNLHTAAQAIYAMNRFPDTLDELMALPGIGQSTAGAILSIAFHKSHPILDGNVKRVLARFLAINGWPGTSEVSKQLWEISLNFTPEQRVADYTQAMMDLGATVCKRTKPHCEKCPLSTDCMAYATQSVNQYPASKMTAVLPVKERVFLLLHHKKKQFYLEKRPSTGIWGGLWCLPEFLDEDAAIAWCQSNQISIIRQQVESTRRHTFSHFHLDYRTLLIETLEPECVNLSFQDKVWYNKQQIRQIGLSSPIKILLNQYINGDY